MLSTTEHLWSHVLNCSNYCFKALGSSLKVHFVANSEVRNFDVALLVQQQVFRLEVSIYVALRMNILQSYHNFSTIESGVTFAKVPLLCYLLKQVSSIHQIKHKVKAFLCLEGIM